MIENKTILCDSNIPWYHNRYSKHHIMSRLAKRNKVIFINPQVEFFQYLRKVQFNPLKFLRRTESPENEFLEVFTPLAVPFRSKFDFVHKIDPWYFRRQLKQVLGTVDRKKLILFLGNPWNVSLLDYFKDCACTLYHCSDNFPVLFKGSFGAKVAEREAQMMTGVDMVIASSELLHEKCLKFNSRSYLITHGVDESFFVDIEGKPSEPEDLRTIKKPRVGFVGSIDRTIDFDLLDYVVATHADKEFVFIGPIDEQCRQYFEKIKTYPNMHDLGRKVWTELPGYVKGFDICLIPFASDEWTKYACPLKLVEYLASGKPVVSTFRVNDNLMGAVKVAGNAKEFSSLVETALSLSREAFSSQTVSALVKDWSWGNKVEELSRLIEDCIRLKGV